MASGGKPTTIISAVISMYQAKIGIRASDILGARILRIVTESSMPTAMDEISTRVIPSSQMSELMSGEYASEDSGVYMNQPEAGAIPSTSAVSSVTPPKR